MVHRQELAKEILEAISTDSGQYGLKLGPLACQGRKVWGNGGIDRVY